MKRFAEESALMRQRLKLAHSFVGKDWKFAKAGRMRKKHPLDCGRPRCGVCHGGKRFGHEKTRQERLVELQLTESAQ